MPFSDRNFGVEIEYTGVSRPILRQALRDENIDVYHDGRGHSEQWSVVYDGSVTEADMNGGEVVSPILSGEEGLNAVDKVARIISRNGGKADRSCGLHVHVDANDLSISELQFIAGRYFRFESQIDAFMPRSRRANNSNYCYSMSYGGTLDRINRITNRNGFYDVSRYHKVNLNAFYKYGTIEFRQHSGTVNPSKIKNWVKFCITFVEESRSLYKALSDAAQLNRNSDFVAPPPRGPIEIEPTPYDGERVRIVNRTELDTNYFRYIGYDERGSLSNTAITYVLRALIRGVDIQNQTIYTYTQSTVRNIMSVLRRAGFNINHTRGTGYYILSEIQPVRVFNGSVIERHRAVTQQVNSTPQIRYVNSIEDSLYRGMDEDVVAFYMERTMEFEEQLQNH